MRWIFGPVFLAVWRVLRTRVREAEAAYKKKVAELKKEKIEEIRKIRASHVAAKATHLDEVVKKVIGEI